MWILNNLNISAEALFKPIFKIKLLQPEPDCVQATGAYPAKGKMYFKETFLRLFCGFWRHLTESMIPAAHSVTSRLPARPKGVGETTNTIHGPKASQSLIEALYKNSYCSEKTFILCHWFNVIPDIVCF